MNRVQNLAISVNKIKFFLGQQSAAARDTPPLRLLTPREVLAKVVSA